MDHVFAIPVYGRSPHVEGCIQSILAQANAKPRILLGTSTPFDELKTLAAKYQLDLLVNPQRRDIASDWNFLLNAARARFVTIAHQDDLYFPGYYSHMAGVAARCEDLVLAFSGYCEHTHRGDRAPNINLRVKRWLCARAFRGRDVLQARADKRRLLSLGNPVCCPSVMINRGRAPDFQFSAALKTNLDWDAWLRLADVPGSFAALNQVLVSKRVHAESGTSVTISEGIRRAEDLQMFRRFWPRPIAAALASIYRTGYLANRVA